jgi:hypothetical protein
MQFILGDDAGARVCGKFFDRLQGRATTKRSPSEQILSPQKLHAIFRRS